MPSIPQSLLWISLVVLWLFVLVPMLINKRDTVRRTSDIALSTRVLNGGAKSRLLRRGGPAAGHRHDPQWHREDADFEGEFEEFETPDSFAATDSFEAPESFEAQGADDTEGVPVPARTMMVLASVTEEIVVETDYLDVDVVDENSGALPVGDGAQDEQGVQASLFEEPAAEEQTDVLPVVEMPLTETAEAGIAEDETDQPASGEYEYIDDTSGLEAEDEPAPAPRRSRRHDSTTAAAVSARKYQFRKRVLMVMAVAMILTAVLSFAVDSGLWWAFGTSAAVTVLYLAYLRRQTRIEEQVRRRRQQRLARSGATDDSMESAADSDGRSRPSYRDYDMPSRLRRPGAVVLDIDDEDPTFEHLDEMPYSRRYDLPRAAGQ